MNTSQVRVSGNAFSRVVWLFGFYTLLFNAAFLVGYHWLPEGFMRSTPATAGGQVAATTQTFWGQLGYILLFNLGGILVASVAMNLFRIKGIPLGYLYPIILAVFTGLVTGTNSFVSSDMTEYNVRDGTALALSIQTFEMLGYLCIIASTAMCGIYLYDSFWQWKPTKVLRLQDVRLSSSERICLVMGILLLILAAYRETLMQFGSL